MWSTPKLVLIIVHNAIRFLKVLKRQFNSSERLLHGVPVLFHGCYAMLLSVL